MKVIITQPYFFFFINLIFSLSLNNLQGIENEFLLLWNNTRIVGEINHFSSPADRGDFPSPQNTSLDESGLVNTDSSRDK